MTDVTSAHSDQDAISRVWELIKDIHIAMLTTADENGRLYSRPMATQQESFNGDLWFLTRQHSEKVAEIRQNAHVSLTYNDAKSSKFICLSGHADVSKDRTKIKELWNPVFKAWFPDGQDDPEISVLKVSVDQAEYWEAPSSAIVRNYRILKRALTRGESKVGEHEKLTLNPGA